MGVGISLNETTQYLILPEGKIKFDRLIGQRKLDFRKVCQKGCKLLRLYSVAQIKPSKLSKI